MNQNCQLNKKLKYNKINNNYKINQILKNKIMNTKCNINKKRYYNIQEYLLDKILPYENSIL